MITRIYNMYAAVTGASNAAAEITFQNRGSIVAIYLDIAVNSVTDNDALTTELSFSNAFQGTTNDSVGPILTARFLNNFTTSGQAQIGRSVPMTNLAIPVQTGDRLYINTGNAAGTPTAVITANIFLATSGRR